MKTVKKIIALLLVCATLFGALMLCSCGKKDRIPLAYMNGRYIYDDDKEIRDYLLYYLTVNEIEIPESVDKMTYEYATAYAHCVDTVIWNRIYEKELRSQKVRIDKKALKAASKQQIASIDESLEGGYKRLCKSMGVSTDLFYNLQRYSAVLAEIYKIAAKEIEVSDEEISNYYRANLSDYIIKIGYRYDVILLEVLDLKSSTEMAEKKAEAEQVLAKLNGGADFAATQKEIIEKYSSDEYFYTSFAVGEATLGDNEFTPVPDLAAALSEIEAMYEEQGIKYDPNADAKSEEFNNYQGFLNSCYRVELVYALTSATKKDQVYEKPILSPLGYVIVKNLGRVENGGFRPLEEVSASIRDTIYKDKVNDSLSVLQEKLKTKYSVVFNATDVQWEIVDQ